MKLSARISKRIAGCKWRRFCRRCVRTCITRLCTLARRIRTGCGTRFQAVAWYDNSKANPHNLDADAAVRWGEQAYDEMMVGFFDVGVPAGVDKQQFFIRIMKNANKFAPKSCTNGRAPGAGGRCGCAICNLNTRRSAI